MPLTSRSTELEDIEANRRIFEAMRARSDQASKGITDGLAGMQALVTKGDADKLARDKFALDENRLVLQQAKDAREETRATEASALAKTKEERDAATHEAGKLVLQRKEEEATRADQRERLKPVLKLARLNKTPMDDVRSGVFANEELGTITDADIFAERAAQEAADKAVSDKATNITRDDERQERFHRDSLDQGAKNRASSERAAAARAAALAGNKGNTNTTGLRKEFNSLPAVKAFGEVQVAYDKMKTAAKTPTAAGDMTMIYGLMKMQDPGSTVRESEFAAAAAAGSLPDRWQGAAEKVVNGQRLAPDQRRDFLAQGENFYTSQKQAYDTEVARYRGIAERGGIVLDDVFGSTPQTGAPAPSADAFDWSQ